MHTVRSNQESLFELVRSQWAILRHQRGQLLTIGIALIFVAIFGVAPAFSSPQVCNEFDVEVACPTDPVGPDGNTVSDQFFFAHQPLGKDGTITARITSMTGTITYPPPNHDEIVPGLVPWAKAGIIVKDGLNRGSEYAALMMTGEHGVRMQHNYTEDAAGQPGSISPDAPRWLRLKRSGDTITGSESMDGKTWTTVAIVTLEGLPSTVKVGLFATSPTDLTRSTVALGATSPQYRFTQASATFDNVTIDGRVPGNWDTDALGESGTTDWEKFHQPAGLTVAGDNLTVTGSGDIGPFGYIGVQRLEGSLVGLIGAILAFILVATRFARYQASTPGENDPQSWRDFGARAFILGIVSFAVGILGAAVAVIVSTMIHASAGTIVSGAGAFTQARVILSAATLLAAITVFTFALTGLIKRKWLALVAAVATVVLPYLLGVVPLFPDVIGKWLLTLTPAAGFAALQTRAEFEQVTVHFAPADGYFPLPGWAGLALTCAWAGIALALARHVIKKR